jgi:hypothetical protein
MNKLKESINLLNQIIEKNIYDDLKSKKHEESGENWNIFHLKLLKQLLVETYENEK